MFWRSFGVYDVPYTHRRSIWHHYRLQCAVNLK
jgi:hypothetical protein